MAINSIDKFVSATTWLVPFVYNFSNPSSNSPASSLASLAYSYSNSHSFGYFGVSGAIPTGGIAISGQYTGCYAVPDAPAGKDNYFLGVHGYNAGNHTRQTVADLLWFCTGSSNNYSQAGIFSVPFPARDASGTTSGHGVYIAATFLSYNNSSTFGITAWTGMSIVYTNSKGESNRTGHTNRVLANVGNIGNGIFLPFNLQDDDVGVRSVERWNWNRMGSSALDNSFKLVAYRPIADIHGTSTDSSAVVTSSITDNGLPILRSGSSLFIITYNIGYATTSRHLMMRFAQG